MPPVPTAEKPPKGLSAEWLGVWRHALKVLKEQGTWKWEQRPLLDEYVFALMEAERARVGFGWLDALELYVKDPDNDVPGVAWSTLGQIASGLPTQWDRHVKRAAKLADVLLLTPEAQRQHGIGTEEEAADPFARFANDELAAKRAGRAS